ncbi:MAG: hypothetical protein EZS28_015318 [Streblomastix strix]|uniref:Integrase catalytic domain-containing protein n=1 Tax=Streblomastix strix TaxID=222440 RepID=A0A5J4W3S0_9EUKA|nr:MAG: hypothetical protein EZS28_015318 [Streblomastix strix]
MTLPVFIRNMHITRSKDETQEFIDNADLIRYGSKFIEQWYQIYRTETQKYNVPKRQLLPKRPQPIPKQEIEAKGQASEEQRIITNPYRTKSRQASQNQIQDYQLKPLKRLQRPYFSPKSGSYEIDLAFWHDTIKHREYIYLFAININTKYLVVIPIIDKSTAQLKNALTKLINSQYVNNIRSDGEKGLTAQSSSEQSDQNDQRWRQEFRASTNDLQLLLIRRLQKTIITNIQNLLQISDIIDRYNQ